MPVAELTITIPEDVWLAAVSTAHPDATFRVISVQGDAETGTGLLEVRADAIVPIVSAMDDRADVADLDLLWKGGDEALVQVETLDPVLLASVSRAGISLKTPFSVTNGVATWEVVTSREKLSELAAHLEAAGVGYELTAIRDLEDAPTDSALTDRQAEVLSVAYDAGYYDTPREATLTEVAEAVGVTKATCSDILHRAEGKIVGAYVAEHLE